VRIYTSKILSKNQKNATLPIIYARKIRYLFKLSLKNLSIRKNSTNKIVIKRSCPISTPRLKKSKEGTMSFGASPISFKTLAKPKP